ncbi:MAG: hypothetical protein ACOC9X_01295 [bacterium]
MADTGKKASFSFDETVYDQDDCLSGWNLADQINEVVYQCGGMDRGAAGTRSAVFSISLALAADDTDKVSALEPGNEGAFEAHPGGDEAGNIEVIATDALVTVANKSAPVNGMITMDVTIRLNDVDLGAAT